MPAAARDGRRGSSSACPRNQKAGSPEESDNRDRLFNGLHGFARTSDRPAHGANAVPEGAGPEAEFDPPPADHIQCRRGFRQHRGRTKGEVGNIRKETHPARHRHECRDQSPGIKEMTIVRVILDSQEVQTGTIRQLGEMPHPRGVNRRRLEAHAELDLASSVHDLDIE